MLAALVLGLFVYSMGHLSGTHINPAVTIGAWSIGKIKTDEAIRYVISQAVGALGALLLSSWVTGGFAGENIIVSNIWHVGLAELLGTFFFTFGIASVIYGNTPKEVSGIAIGGSLLLGISIAVFSGSNGVLNPAVALGIHSFGVMYILGPIIGSVLGMQVYKKLLT
jgi:glycerol uptake facilitator-like aquaporin